MGHYNPAGDTQIVQELSPGIGEVNGVPVYWNGKLYVFGGVSPIKAFSLNNGLFSTTPVVQSATLIGGGHVATISANVNTNGILWVINGTNMQAYGAGTLKLLYTTKDAGTRDTLPTTAHFATQTVANGKVYVATRQNLVVYGLFPALLTVAGNNQTAIVNTVLPVALKIKAVDPYSGQPFSGVTVTFSDGGKGGTFSTTTPVTDANGFASTTYTLSKIARTVTITASVAGFAGAVLTETGTPAAPKWIVPLKGNNQSAPVTTQLPAALVVKVADQYSNGVPGITFDADDNTGINAQPLWQVSFINPAAGITTVPGTVQGCTGVTAFTELGIVSTPVIDPNTGTLYVIAKTDENGTFVHRLHALDVATGQEKFNGPVKLKATFRTNTGSVATFKDLYQMNRPGLLLVNGTIYAGFGLD